MKTHLVKLADISTFAKSMAKTIQGGEIIALIGPLGAGKTTFAKHFGKALGVTRTIKSPTFIFSQEFTTGKKTSANKPIALHHLDLYRLRSGKDAPLLGLEEFWGKPESVTIIEWADRIQKLLPKNTIVIKFT